MNRRQLFAGAGAAALSAVVPKPAVIWGGSYNEVAILGPTPDEPSWDEFWKELYYGNDASPPRKFDGLVSRVSR